MATAAADLSSSENQLLLPTETNCISSAPTTPTSEVAQNNNERRDADDEKPEVALSDGDCDSRRAQHKQQIDAELTRSSNKPEMIEIEDAAMAPDAVVDLLSTVDGYFSGSKCGIPTSLYGTPLTTVVEAVYSSMDFSEPSAFGLMMPLPETTIRNGLKETVV